MSNAFMTEALAAAVADRDHSDAQLAAIEAVVRQELCPVENSEPQGDDEPEPRYICENEDGDRIIEAADIPGVIRQIVAAWDSSGVRCQAAELKLEAIEREMQIAHSLLSETRAKVTDGQPIWARFEWFKTVLVRERDEAGALRLAAEAELDALRHQLAASEHRRNAAENRADAMRMERDALLKSAPGAQVVTPGQTPRSTR